MSKPDRICRDCSPLAAKTCGACGARVCAHHGITVNTMGRKSTACMVCIEDDEPDAADCAAAYAERDEVNDP